MKLQSIVSLLLALFITSCASASTPTVVPSPSPASVAIATISPTDTPTITPTDTPTPTKTATLTPTSSATPRPTAQVITTTSLYSGPGDIGYPKLADLAQSTTVFPLATFVDFIKVQTEISGTLQIGFVTKNSLANLSSGLPELESSAVPWMPVVDAIRLSGWGPVGVFTQDSNLTHYSVPSSWITTENVLDTLWVNGPFRVQVQFSGEGQSYAVVLFGRSNHGDWWEGVRRLDLDGSYGNLALLFYDGTSQTPQYLSLPRRLKGDAITLEFDQSGQNVTVFDNSGYEVGSMHLTATLFPDKVFHFGVNAGLGGVLHISNLKLLAPPSGSLTKSHTTVGILQPNLSTGLRVLAEQRGLEFGSLGSWARFGDLKYDDFLASNYDLLLSEDFHWGYGLRPDAQHYNFSAGDQIVAFAQRYGMRVQAHHLVWGFEQTLPKWLLNGNYTRDQLLQLINDHINTVVGHFKGRVNEWTVVNEVFGGNDQFWGPRIGPEYIEMAFRWAHEADPNAVLILNQFADEDRRNQFNQTITDQTFNLIKDLKQKGVPINGVGMQMHLSITDPPKKQDVIQNMRHFAELGVSVYVTELDVNLYGASGTMDEKYARQAQVYRDMLEACLESGVCKSFTMFGFRDADSWLLDPNVQRDLGLHGEAPLILDNNYNLKPAYFALRDVLVQR